MHLDRSFSPAEIARGLSPRDADFIELLRAFRGSGGLAREDDIVERRALARAPLGLLGADAEQLICFEWNDRLCLPWFQFDPETLNLRSGPASIIAELLPVFDGWSMATWFAQPNLWLGNVRPIELLDSALPHVLGAARVDRFIAGN
jgi:hypothetical protein